MGELEENFKLQQEENSMLIEIKIDFDRLKDDNVQLKREIEEREMAIRGLNRKLKTFHNVVFGKPELILELLKSDGLLMSYLDRVYQKSILDYKKLEKRVNNLVLKDHRMKRSHSFDY